MKAVLYAHDMTPITVLSVPQHWWDFLEKHGSFMVAVPEEPPTSPAPFEIDYATRFTFRTVRITVEVLVYRRRRHMMLFTEDEESALLLKSAFLPGQYKRLNELKEEAYAMGFWNAVRGDY